MRARGWSLPVLFLAARLVLILSLPVDGLTGYGDLIHFFSISRLDGLPFFDHWVEFPPLFPFLAALLLGLAGGQEHVHAYLLAIVFSLVQAASLALFLRLGELAWGQQGARRRAWIYLALLAGLFYGWAYFDPLVVFALLAGLYFFLRKQHWRAGAALGTGMLLKWFPALALPALWRYRQDQSGSRQRAAWTTAVASGLVVLVWSGLYLRSPAYTLASFRAQGSKGSWETVWALVDGNWNTGNFGALEERYDPRAALVARGNPPRIPPILTLIPFAGLGLFLFYRLRLDSPRRLFAFTGLTLILFYLWSPGYSPQWVLYLLPLILLSLAERNAGLMALALVLVNLLEWPLLLSRGLFDWLWLPVLVRTALLVLLGVEFWRAARTRS